ncbi:MAG: amidase, partial [Actinobacteria bacterium]|nr:amidase [Actinomycetota bacterium]
MTDAPWLGDACSLVEEFRSGRRSPAEELEATLAAIDRSELNAFTWVDEEGARAAAASADVSLPFGGVPVGIKSLERVAGWPDTEQSLVFADRVAAETSTNVERLRGRGGIVAVGQTLASEFGGLNISTNRLSGTCHNPWRQGATAGGSSGGSSSAVAGGLVTIAS